MRKIIDSLKTNWGTENYTSSERLSGEYTFPLKCTFSEKGILIDDTYPRDVPKDIQAFWNISKNALLFNDTKYGQWGLEILTPEQSLIRTEEERESRPDSFEEYDLVLGEFLGDSDLLVVFCKTGHQMYGAIMIATPLDPRKDWYLVAPNFESFLEEYSLREGDKYWASLLKNDIPFVGKQLDGDDKINS